MLTRIEIQGFKSFADKTIIELPTKTQTAKKPITAIVGPNGSGKSNIADAIRWVLGEHSSKSLRGDKSEDIIFYGSKNRSRAGMAEVSLSFNNETRLIPLEQSEVKITRRLYRDGTAEYLLNNTPTKFSDLQLLLTKANFGKESYAVIAQGMIDHLLLMGGTERKTFFDEATGVRHLQIKKEQAIKKLINTEANLKQAKLLLEEIEPRLRSLTRQVKRLEERKNLEETLFELEKNYYSTLWQSLEKQKEKLQNQLEELEKEIALKNEIIKKGEEVMKSLEFEETQSEVLLRLQKEFQSLLERKQSLKEKEISLRARLTTRFSKEPKIDFEKMLIKLTSLLKEFETLIEMAEKIKRIEEIPLLKNKLAESVQQLKDLLNSLSGNPTNDKQIETEFQTIQKEIESIDQKLQQIQKQFSEINQSEQSKKASFFSQQKELNQRQEERRVLETKYNEIKIELAKLEVQGNNLESEMQADLKEKVLEIKKYQSSLTPEEALNLLPQIQKLKRQLEWIEGIDPEVVKEYNETKERHSSLQTQCQDLEKSISSIIQLIDDLEENIQKQFENSFTKINEKFNEYFKILFGGGQAKLIRISSEKNEKSENSEDEVNKESIQENEKLSSLELNRLTSETTFQEIEIQAIPPGKKVKNINMLSGGEKALTSIALVSAVLSVNPPPFLILDEVDAALDENNSLRFARILDELSTKTQLIVITHNRATMQAADVLYGVTMGQDGVSKILSLKLEETKD
jgi:chromosome segregation protein